MRGPFVSSPGPRKVAAKHIVPLLLVIQTVHSISWRSSPLFYKTRAVWDFKIPLFFHNSLHLSESHFGPNYTYDITEVGINSIAQINAFPRGYNGGYKYPQSPQEEWHQHQPTLRNRRWAMSSRSSVMRTLLTILSTLPAFIMIFKSPILSIALLAFLLRHAAAEPNGKWPTGSSTAVYLSDSDDCSVYYECHNGTPLESHCTSPYVYNEAMNSCDEPESVDCGNRQ